VSWPRASKPRLLTAHDPATRIGIRIALDGLADVCAEASSAGEAVALADHQQPDVCLVGLEIPGGGIAATRGIRHAAPEAVILIMARSLDPDDLLECVRAGATGYLPSSIPLPALRRTISRTLSGEAAVPRSMVLELLLELQGSTRADAGELTAREAQVLAMLRRGQPTAAIAHRLGISPVTVRRHISAVMRKTGAEGRAALAGNSGRDRSVARSLAYDAVDRPRLNAH